MPLGENAIVLLSYRIEYETQRYLFTQTFRVQSNTSTDFPANDTQAIVNFFMSSASGTLLEALRKCLGTNATIRECIAQGIYPIRFVRRSGTLALAGTGVGLANTGNVAGVLTFTTDLAGRSQVANKHIGPPPSAEVVAGAPTTGYRLDLGVLGQRIIDTFLIPGMNPGEDFVLVPVIFHKSNGTSNPITARIASTRIGTMRRRTLRVGE